MSAIGVWYMALIMLKYVPSISILLRVFNHKYIFNFSKGFSASIDVIIWFLFFSLLIRYITLSEKVGLKLNIQKTKIMASGPIASWKIDGETVTDFIFLSSKITVYGDCSHEIKRYMLLGRKVMANLDSILKSRHYFANKDTSSQSYGFSSSHVWMWELNYKESWAWKNWCFWTVVLEKTLESPLDSKEIQPVQRWFRPFLLGVPW